MMAITMNVENLAIDFTRVAALAGIEVPLADIEIVPCFAPHRPPPELPTGKQGVYVFLYAGRCLKVGKFGPNSEARYCSHHYGIGRAPSTLAKSLIGAQSKLGITGLDESNVASFICQNMDRVNFLLPAEYGPFVHSLLEVFVQCRLRPELEGFESQRQMTD